MTLYEKVNSLTLWDRCDICDRPKLCDSNVWKLRGIIAGCASAGFVLGAYSLSTFGFGDGGVGAATFAAAWQSGIGNVVPGSTFAFLQALGATGTGKILFGGTGAALGALVPFARKMEWCEKSGSKDCIKNPKKL